MIRCIFLYLDRTYILQTAGSSSLWDMGLEIFRDLVTSNASIKARTVRGILNLVEKERQVTFSLFSQKLQFISSTLDMAIQSIGECFVSWLACSWIWVFIKTFWNFPFSLNRKLTTNVMGCLSLIAVPFPNTCNTLKIESLKKSRESRNIFARPPREL